MESPQQYTPGSAACLLTRGQDHHKLGRTSQYCWYSKMSRCSEQHCRKEACKLWKDPLRPGALHQPQLSFSQVYWAHRFYLSLQIFDQLGAGEESGWRAGLAEKRKEEEKLAPDKQQLRDCLFTWYSIYSVLLTDNNSQYFLIGYYVPIVSFLYMLSYETLSTTLIHVTNIYWAFAMKVRYCYYPFSRWER